MADQVILFPRNAIAAIALAGILAGDEGDTLPAGRDVDEWRREYALSLARYAVRMADALIVALGERQTDT